MTEPVAPVAHFLREHAPALAEWTDETLANWLAYHLQRRRAVVVRNADGQIVGFGAARCLSDSTIEDDWYGHDIEGDTIFVDLVVATGPGVMRALWEFLLERYGPRKRLAFRRLRDERRREYDFEQFSNHLRHGK